MNSREIALFAIGPIGAAALSLCMLPLVAWFYSVEDIGRIAMLQVMVSFCLLLFSLGLDQAYVREYYESENKPGLLKSVFLPGFLLLVLGGGVCFFEPSFLAESLFSLDSVMMSFLVVLCFIASFVSRFLSLVLRMQGRGLAFSIGQILPKMLFLIIMSGYVFFSYGFEFYYLLIAHIFSAVFLTVVYAYLTYKDVSLAYKQKINLEKLKSMLYFGAPLIMGGAAFWGLTTMDRLFLRSYSNFEELGIYSMATNFAAAGLILQSIFSTVWAPIVYKWAAEGVDASKIHRVTEHLLAVVVFLFVMAGLGSWVVTFILPEGYREVRYLLVACMAYPLFYTLSETTVVGIGVSRKSGYSMLASIVAVSVNFTGNYLLVPVYGAAGAAISTAFSFWVFLICRTELSCLVWRQVPRFKLYVMTLVCLILSFGSAFYSEKGSGLMILAWGVMGLVAVWSFRGSIALLVNQVVYFKK